MTLSSAQVQTLLTDILGETASSTADSTDLSEYMALSNLGGANTLSTLANQIALAPEAGIAQQIYRLYEAVLGRAPDAAGLQNWVAVAEQGLSVAQIQQGVSSVSQATWNTIINGFTASAEFQANYKGIGGAALVDLLYKNILGRNPDPTGLATWTAILGTDTAGSGPTPASIIEVVNGIANSAEFIKDSLANNTASTVAAALADTGTGPTYSVSPIVPPTSIVALTTGVDALTPTGSTTVDGTTATFQAGDSIIATGSGNILNLTDLTGNATAYNFSTVGATVSGVQTVTISSSTEALTGNFSAWSGLTTLNVNSVLTANDTITVGSGTALNWNIAGSAAENITAIGGTVDTISVANAVVDNHTKMITVDGGSATTSVTVDQTVATAGSGDDAAVVILDTNGGTTKAGTITSVVINGLDSAVAAPAATITDNALTSLTAENVLNQTVEIFETAGAASAATTLALIVDGDTGLTVQDAISAYTALNITVNSTISSSSTVAALTGFSGVTALTVSGSGELIYSGTTDLTGLSTLTISGTAGLSADLHSLSADKLTTITATNNGSNINNLTIDATAETFTHTGSARDIITVLAAPTVAISAGSATNNELVYDLAGTGAQTSLLGAGGSISGFTVLGTGSFSTGTYDLTTNSGFTAIDVNGAVTGNLIYTRVVAGTSLEIDANAGHTITYQTADSTGASDSLALTVGVSSTDSRVVDGLIAKTTAQITAATSSLTAEDSTGAGIASLSVTSYDSTAGAAANTISALVDTKLSSLSISGTGAFLFGSTETTSAASLTIANSDTSTVASGLTSLTDSALATLTFSGTGLTSISGTLTDSVQSLTIAQNDTNTHGVTISTLADTALNGLTDSGTGGATNITNLNTSSNLLNIANTSGGTLTIGTLTDAPLATLTLTGSAKEVISSLAVTTTSLVVQDSSTAAVTISNSAGNTGLADTSATTETFQNTGSGTLTVVDGGSDTVLNSLTLSGKIAYTALGLADTASITVSGSADNASVTLAFTGAEATNATDTVTLGNGNNSITFAATAGAGAARSVTLGNGNNTVDDHLGATGDVITVSVGSGTNNITLGAAHTVADTITFSAANGGSSSNFTTVTNATHVAADTFVFATAAVNSTVAYEATAVTSIAAGISAANLSDGINVFNDGTNTYIYEYTGSAATSEVVKLAGVVLVANIAEGVDLQHFHL